MDGSAVKAHDEFLRIIAEGTAALTGEEFFRELVRSLARALEVRCAFVSEFRDVNTRVCTLAFYEDGRFLDNFVYDLEHTPCERVLKGDIGYYPRDVQRLFPHHREDLAAHQAVSYLAIPMIDRQGQVLGHLACIDSKPMDNPTRELAVFRIFGARAAAELERQRAEEALRRSEERLANVLASAMDTIITVDASHRITLFNRAAEQAFRCSGAWAIGQPIERFFAPAARTVLSQYLGSKAASEDRQLWAPEGLHAVRATGEEFPIEATVSPLVAGGERHFTVILRDINDRERAGAELRRVQNEHRNLQEAMQRAHAIDGFVGTAPAMQPVLDAVRKVADTDTTVLITGETGTGKELVARAVHAASSRRHHPLVPVNCAALPAELIESELFGHERGAFTGATGLRRGRFELAHGGTIFLDEVGELTAQAQAKLLRVLQEQCFERVGGSHAITVDVRLIAATNRNLQDMVARGAFRADLYYRLNVFPIQVPPLRERRSDVPLLAKAFLEKYARKLGKEFEGFGPVSLERLCRYAWPGNVRELQNVIERAVIFGTPPLLEIATPLLMSSETAEHGHASGAVDEVVRAHIVRVLDAHRWVIEGPRGAAAVLDMKPSTLRYRMRQLGIAKPAAAPAKTRAGG